MHGQTDKFECRVVIPSDTAQGHRVQEEILARIGQYNYDDADQFAIRLAVEEALINAIKHGNGSDPTKKIHIEYRVTPEEFFIKIEDEGPGFDPNAVPDPTDPEFLERPSGRGLMLMRYYMSEVSFNERGNCVIMVKRRSDSREGAEEEQETAQ